MPRSKIESIEARQELRALVAVRCAGKQFNDYRKLAKANKLPQRKTNNQNNGNYVMSIRNQLYGLLANGNKVVWN